MKKFNFKLETVLKLREKFLEDKLLELAKIMKIQKEAEEELERLFQERTDVNNQIVEIYSIQDNIDYPMIDVFRNYTVKLTSKARQQEALVNEIKTAVRIKQREVQEAIKNRDILRKLREKQFKNYYKELESKEMQELDDITICRYKVS